MPTWKIVAVVVFMLLSLQNVRMVLVYFGIVKSAVIGPIFDIAFALNQLRALALKIGFIAAVWLVDWPEVLIYMVAVWTAIKVLDLLRIVISVGTTGEIIMGIKQTAEDRRGNLIAHAIQVGIFMGVLWAMVHFIGI